MVQHFRHTVVHRHHLSQPFLLLPSHPLHTISLIHHRSYEDPSPESYNTHCKVGTRPSTAVISGTLATAFCGGLVATDPSPSSICLSSGLLLEPEGPAFEALGRARPDMLQIGGERSDDVR